MKKNSCFIGIDTSNYTTSVSAVSYDGRVLLNYKMPLAVKNGERGLRQSDAVYAHIKNQPSCMTALSSFLLHNSLKVLAVGYSASPVNSPDSFMPVFNCGRAFAASLATCKSLPTYAFSHQEGHIAAASYSATGSLELIGSPFYAFHVSGGTTDIVKCSIDGNRIKCERLGGSSDLHAGQLIDRVGVMLGLKFPCGPALELLAEKCENWPSGISVSVNDLDSNLSGGENKAKEVFNMHGAESAAMYTLSFIAKTLDTLSENIRKNGIFPILYSGGVMSNKYIKSVLSKRSNTYFASPEFSADNAAGIALLTRNAYLN